MSATHVVEARRAGDTIELVGPSPGLFHARVAIGDVVSPGSVLGDLEVLGKTITLVAPEAANGRVIAIRDPALASVPVEFGIVLVALDPRAGVAGVAVMPQPGVATSVTGLVFRAPTGGRYYGRSAPDKPAFVSVGSELAPGATVCLLEVMKTFHRVTYGGAGLPDRARVRELLVAEGADVSVGDPLLALEAI